MLRDPVGDRLIRKREARDRLAVAPATLDRLIRKRVLRTVKLGPRLVRVRESDLMRLIGGRPTLVHRFVGHTVRTDIVIAGVGETFHVPRAWSLKCDEKDCTAQPVKIPNSALALLEMCRMSHTQLTGFMRHAGGCAHRAAVKVTTWATITELLALPTANADMATRDYREKIVSFVGSLSDSHIRYRATGKVIAEPKRQRASLLIHALDRLQSAAESFRLTPELRGQLEVFRVPPTTRLVDDAERHTWRIAATVTETITKVFGTHRVNVLLAELLVCHSPREIRWKGERIKGTVDLLVIGDTGQGKTTQYRRLSAALGLGHFASGSTSSRTGVLYTLDSKVNDKRVLRWGAFPLAHGELLAIDEAQNIPREQWAEFTTALSEGVLKVDRAIRAEHPSRTRLIAFANPVGRTTIAEFQYGIMAVHPEHGFLTIQDLRRFDVVACVSEGDQTAEDIRRGVDAQDLLPLAAGALRASVLWAWTRTANDVDYAPQTVRAIHSLADALNKTFGTPDIPLLITDAPEKVARLAVAFATLLHSTDSDHRRVIVTPLHVALVGRLLAAIYKHPNCAFDELRSRPTAPGRPDRRRIQGDQGEPPDPGLEPRGRERDDDPPRTVHYGGRHPAGRS